MFDHRLASHLGTTVEDMLETMTPPVYRRWQIYWLEEPWGPYRDNLHAAIIAREIQRPNLRKGATVNMAMFMVKRPIDQAKARVNAFVNFLFSISKPAKPPRSKP